MGTVDEVADELARMAAALREAGETGWRKQVLEGIKRAADPVPAAIRAGLRPHLPDRYADVLNADLRLTISVRAGSADPGVIVTGSPIRKQRKLNAIETGNLRHPVFADRTAPRRTWRWKDQGLPSVKPGWFTGPASDAAPEVRKEIEKALDEVNAVIWAAVHG